MKLSKNTDVSNYETKPHKIAAHLCATFNGIRKKKLEAEYTLDKELLDNLNVEDLVGVNEGIYDLLKLNDSNQICIDVQASKLAKSEQ